MLKRVKIQGYKSLEDVEVQLQPLSVLFGPNASGKSNFLDALQLLSRIATSRTLKEAFDPPYRGTPLESFTFGLEGMKSLRDRERVSFSIEVDIELSQPVIESVNNEIAELKEARITEYVKEKYLRYHLEVEMLPKLGTQRVASESLMPLDKEHAPNRSRVFIQWNGTGKHLHIEGRRAYRLEYLDHSILSRTLYPDQSPHVVAVRRELERWLFFYLEPRERMRIPTPVKEVRHIGLMGEEIAAFLNTLRALDEKQFNAVEKALHLIIPSITDIDVSVNDSGFVELKLMQGQTPIPASVLSEGTLRILGLLVLGSAQESPTLLGFEEPENGIYPDRLDLIARLLTTLSYDTTQVVVTTHSPTLLDLLPQEALYVFRMKNGRTFIDPLGKRNTSYGEEESVSERLLRGSFYA
jgi:predicted ATPase